MPDHCKPTYQFKYLEDNKIKLKHNKLKETKLVKSINDISTDIDDEDLTCAECSSD